MRLWVLFFLILIGLVIYGLLFSRQSFGADLPTISQDAEEQKVFFIGEGGRYKLQYLDSRDVAYWFGGYTTTGTPQVPVALGR